LDERREELQDAIRDGIRCFVVDHHREISFAIKRASLLKEIL
tara:strand:+ start:1514 stop:1639 length:126 start_codon:yes stop_codon:yes gene_type:complete